MVGWIRRFVSATLARTRFEREMRRELLAHVELRADDLEASGLSREEAMRRARVEFGAMERYKEQCRDARGFAAFRPLHGSLQDLRIAVRRLAATPVFFLFGIASLAIAVAVPSVAYAILYSVLWKPLGASDPERVLLVTTPAGRSVTWSGAVSLPDFEDLQRAQTSFVSIAASTRVAPSVGTRLGAEMASGEVVTSDYFAALGVRPAFGRLIGPEDDDQRVVVISENLWRERFEADPSIVGQTLLLNGQRFDIVGVTDFIGLGAPEGASQDLWIPLNARTALEPVPPPNRTRRNYVVFGRLKETATPDGATAELQAISQRLDAAFPIQQQDRDGNTVPVQRKWGVRGLDNPHPDSEIHRVGAVVLALVALVLVVACTNLANLMLARGAARAQELAMRRALGASPWRLVREMCAEGLLMGAAGGLLSLVVMQGLLNLATIDIPTPRGAFYLRPEINVSVLASALGAVFLSLLVFSLEPAIHLARRTQVSDVTKGLTPGAIERTRRHWMLVRGQVAISVCFFLVAALLVRFVAATAVHDSGVELSRLSLATVHFRFTPGQWDLSLARRIVDGALQTVGREPAVRSVAVSTGAPFGLNLTPWALMTTPDKPFVDKPETRYLNVQDYVSGSLVIASDSIFDTLGVPVLRGRAFDHRDTTGTPLVAVLSQRAAVQVFGTEDAIGQRLLLRSNTRVQPDLRATATVIGIARDTDVGELMRRNDGTVYLPLSQSYQADLVFIVNSDSDPDGMARLLQAAIAKAAPDLPVGTVGSGLMMLAPELVAARVAGSLAAGLGAVTLLLAMIGLYGIQSAIVARRTREVGVRIALGAAAHQIHRMILRDGLVPVAQGVVAGLLFGTLVRMTLRAVMSAGIEAVDPPAILVVPLVLGLAAVLACYLPARRAARVDPNVALRQV